MIARGWVGMRGENGKLRPKWHRVSLGSDENILGFLERGDAYTTL